MTLLLRIKLKIYTYSIIKLSGIVNNAYEIRIVFQLRYSFVLFRSDTSMANEMHHSRELGDLESLTPKSSCSLLNDPHNVKISILWVKLT